MSALIHPHLAIPYADGVTKGSINAACWVSFSFTET
jgi:hypothetical protein